MSNIKEQIRQEIERLKEENRNIRCERNEQYCTGYDDAFNDLLIFIDSLPEETCKDSLQAHETCKENTDSFTDDLDKAASRGGFDYVDEIEAKAPGLPWNDHDVEFGYRDGFIAGSNWQKEQIMKDAVEGEIGYWNQRGLSIRLDKSLERLGYDMDTKVKIIIIKGND